MDWQRIKDRVTEEVLRQLQGDKVVASPERVQQLIVSAIGGGCATVATPVVEPLAAALADHPPVLPACNVGPEFKTDMLVVVAGPACDRVVAAIKSLAEKNKVTVVAAASDPRLSEVQSCGQVLCSGSEEIARRLVKGATAIVAPVMSTSIAAKVAGLIGDCLPSAVMVQAALLGKRVVIAKESPGAPAGSSWSVRRKVEEVSISLRTLGFVLSDLNAITAEARSMVKDSSGTGFAPAYTPHPAVLASRAAKAAAQAGRLDSAPSPQATEAVDFDRVLARMIDHTLLKPESTADQVTKLCREAIEYGFCSVCVNPTWVPLCAKLLAGTSVKVCTVIGFPLGATSANSKSLEAADAIQRGAHEVDMVMNVGALKSGEYDQVLNDMKAVVQAAKGKALVKVILEVGLLTNDEKVKACQIAKEAGADFVKTSTGFGPGGATPAEIALMRKTVGPTMGVKASGGIRDYDAAQAVVKVGATRLGTSASIAIVKRVKAQPAKDKY